MPSRLYPPAMKLKSGFWYLASPYTKWKNKDDAAAHVAALSGRLLAQGVTTFSPIAHWHYIRQYAPALNSMTHAEWLKTDKLFVDQAYGLLVAGLPGWNESSGVAQEIAWFKEAGKPMFLLDPMDLGCSRSIP